MDERRKIKTFCALCVARCGAIATVENGRYVALEPDPTHPTGQALCAKGRASPELVYSRDRLLHPLKRTRPKGDADPGWQRIGWDEALDLTASAMRRIAEQHGPHAFASSVPSASTTASADYGSWNRRFMNAYGSPNVVGQIDICGWGRSLATRFTFGTGSVGVYPGDAMADIANAGCLILWGYNPSMSRLTHATAAIKAMRRGMKLIVVDPRQVGLANKADVWLRVRPGSDGALALGIANLMIERGWFDRDFIRDWTNGPMLVRDGRLLTERDLRPDGSEQRLVAWNSRAAGPVLYDTASGRYEQDDADPALDGEYRIATATGPATCRPVFALYAELCRQHPPEKIEATCWIPREKLEEAARLIWQSRPVAYYAWSGMEQHANVTQTARALSLLYALTGSFDRAGGNVILPTIPSGPIVGGEFPAAKKMVPPIGIADRPLGPERINSISCADLYRAILDGKPYPVRGFFDLGTNILVGHGNARRGREALAALDFYVHADMFMNPTAELADVFLPVTSQLERETVRFGFEISLEAQSLLQLRSPIIEPLGEARPEFAILSALAHRLGFGEQFWNGDIDAAHGAQLAPSGVTLEKLRATPGGVRVPLEMRHAKHAERDKSGNARGFATPSHKVELWSETLRTHGQPPLPEFAEPAIGLARRPDLAERYPLVLTCAKNSLFCNSQHRGVGSLRKRQTHPEVEIHPQAASERGIANGEWVSIETPGGGIRAVARFNASLDPRVVVGQHGWWQACDDQDAPSYNAFSADSSSFNLLVPPDIRDPVSGTLSVRANLCQVRVARGTR